MPSKTHGRSKTPVYFIWKSMKRRCCAKGAERYKSYGERGIKVCNRWLHSFENFLEDMGERPAGMTLDRIDVNGDYCKENCRWLSKFDQMSNTTRSKYLTYNGKKKTLAQWSRITKINRMTISRRISSLGWSIDKALKIDPNIYKNRGKV